MDSLSYTSQDIELLIANQQAMMDSLQVAKQALLEAQASLNDSGESGAITEFNLHNLWMVVCTALVLIMHLGFATLESGLTRAKNTVNVLFKNTFIPLVGLVTHALCGFSLMFPNFENSAEGFLGFRGLGLRLPTEGLTAYYNGTHTYWTEFLFQGMFAATCATIVSGAVAERIRLSSFMIFSSVFVALVYPIVGSWTWGKGWLYAMDFHDFAGSTLVHSVGGWAALACVLLLGPRYGKYEHGKIMPIQGHSMTSATIGAFLLWLGWFGFNGGSVLSADAAQVSKVLINTCLSACVSGLAASFTILIVSKKYDLTMTLNGILAGLVGITAGADQMGVLDSCNIGAVAGMLVVGAVLFFDRIKIDDPVGALSVHLVCGIWGTLAVALFGDMASPKQIVVQLIGISACGVASFISSLSIFAVLKYTMGIRVTRDEEIYGLDFVEHGIEAYPDFVSK